MSTLHDVATSRIDLRVIGLALLLALAFGPMAAGATVPTDSVATGGNLTTWKMTTSSSPPSASFTYSPSTPNPDDTVTLDASGSTDNGTIEEYEWDTDGDGNYGECCGRDASDGQTTSVSFDTGGTYRVGVKVTDQNGLTDTTTERITVENPAPSASFSYTPSTPNPDDSISLDASGSSDEDGTIEEYEWDTDGDGNYGECCGRDASDGQTASVSFDEGGTYRVGLKVTDNGDKSTTTTQQITVENPAPTASFTYSPSTPNPDDSITLDASGSSDDDGEIVSYEWDTDGDGNYGECCGRDASDGQTASVSFDEGGTYRVGLKVTDNGDKSRTTTKQITVENPPPSASFSYSPSTPNPDDTIALDASGSSDSDGEIVSYEWDTDGDGSYGECCGRDASDGQTASVSFDEGGTYRVGLKITDNGDKSRTTTQRITVENPAPTASFTYSPSTPNPAKSVTLDASGSSDDDGEIVSYEWDTDGDGSYGECCGRDASDGQTTSTVFDEGGTYRIGLRVTDNGDKTATTSQQITVENKGPSASFSISPSAPKPDQSVRFDGSSSNDPDGTLGTYIWSVDGREVARGQRVTHEFDTDGTKTVSLKVVDIGGKTATASERITVENTKPAASFTMTPAAPTPADDVRFDASASSDEDGTVEAFGWLVDGDAIGRGETITHTFDDRGDHTVELRIADNGGLTASTSKTVSVSLPPDPSISIAPETIGQGNSVTFDASESVDPDGEISEYIWRFDDGTTKRGESVTRTFSGLGESSVTLTVVDDTGHRIETTTEYRVYESPEASMSISPEDPIEGNAVALEARSPDDIQAYRWKTEDGSTYTGASTSHTFTESGQRTVVLSATSTAGVTSHVSRTVSVDPDATFELTSNQGQVGVGDTAVITFSVNNNIPGRDLEARLQLALPDTGVSIASVEGARITSRSTTNFFTVPGGGQDLIRVRMRFNEPGTYDIGGDSTYFYGNQSNSRQKSVASVSISVGDEEEQSGSGGSGPGFGVLPTLFGLLCLLAWSRFRE